MRKNILLIEDEEPVRYMVALSLESEGHRVAPATCASEAKSLLEHQTFALIILDLILPDTDGFDFLVWLKSYEPKVPVLILTGMDYEEDILVGAQDAGADGFVSKLDSVENLFSEARRLLKFVPGK